MTLFEISILAIILFSLGVLMTAHAISLYRENNGLCCKCQFPINCAKVGQCLKELTNA